MNKRVTGLSPEALNILLQYDWPGNVRELRNFIEKALIEMRGDTILASHLPVDITMTYEGKFREFKSACKLPEAEAVLKREMIIEALQRSRGNKSKAAAILGVSRAGLRKMIRSLSMENDIGR
jgi:DNA-binding NtrC family response regulator